MRHRNGRNANWNWIGPAPLACLLLAPFAATGGDDPSIPGEVRAGVRSAMYEFVAGQTIDGRVLHFDAVDDELRRLRFSKLHEGIVKKGEFYIACADFVNEKDAVVDLDLLVRREDDSFRMIQAIVHAVSGKKRKYHLE